MLRSEELLRRCNGTRLTNLSRLISYLKDCTSLHSDGWISIH